MAVSHVDRGRRAEAIEWLYRRRSWEQRLATLERSAERDRRRPRPSC